jgi:hypothetical protein
VTCLFSISSKTGWPALLSSVCASRKPNHPHSIKRFSSFDPSLFSISCSQTSCMASNSSFLLSALLSRTPRPNLTRSACCLVHQPASSSYKKATPRVPLLRRRALGTSPCIARPLACQTPGLHASINPAHNPRPASPPARAPYVAFPASPPTRALPSTSRCTLSPMREEAALLLGRVPRPAARESVAAPGPYAPWPCPTPAAAPSPRCSCALP